MTMVTIDCRVLKSVSFGRNGSLAVVTMMLRGFPGVAISPILWDCPSEGIRLRAPGESSQRPRLAGFCGGMVLLDLP